jgi:hypothetical protein
VIKLEYKPGVPVLTFASRVLAAPAKANAKSTTLIGGIKRGDNAAFGY